MFPARAGMSRLFLRDVLILADVPRASGDEPDKRNCSRFLGSCSPRERG